MKKRGGIGSMGSGKPTARPTKRKSNTLENVYKKQRQLVGKSAAKTKPQALQISKPLTTQTPRQKAIAAVKARSAAKRAEILKNFNSLTPAQKTAMKQRQQAKALSFKQRQGTNQATPTKTTGTLGNPTSAQKEIIKNNSNTAMQKAKPLSAPQKQMPRTTSSVSDRLKKIVGSTVARRRAAAIARRKAAAMARRKAAVRTVRRPTGRTVYKSRTTIPTRRRRK